MSSIVDNGSGVFHMETDDDDFISAGNADEEFSGNPITPRGDNGLLKGDDIAEALTNMGDPETLWFAVVPVEKRQVGVEGKNGEKKFFKQDSCGDPIFDPTLAGTAIWDPILYPKRGADYAAFPSRESSREVAERLCEHEQPIHIYGPYESEEQVAARLWERPSSTPCDAFEWREQVVRRRYFPRGHPKQGQLAGRDTSWSLFRMDFGFQTNFSRVNTNLPEYKVPGSLLTSYLKEDGSLIHNNVELLSRTRPGKQDASNSELSGLNAALSSAQRNRLDAYVDKLFRKYLVTIQQFNDPVNPVNLQWAFVHRHHDLCRECTLDAKLLTGVNRSDPGKLPREFAAVLRTCLNSYYGRATHIILTVGIFADVEIDLTLYDDE